MRETTVMLCLDSDLQTEWEEANTELEWATKAPSAALLNNPDVTVLAQRVADIEQRWRDLRVPHTFRHVHWRRWADLMTQNPPREGNQNDAQFGYSVDAVCEQAMKESLVSPVLDDTGWAELDNRLTYGQWLEIRTALLVLNAGRADIPFSPLASRILQHSAQTSRPLSG